MITTLEAMVARAICDSKAPGQIRKPTAWRSYVGQARAAIKAYRQYHLEFPPDTIIPGKEYRVIMFTLAFRMEEPTAIDLEEWRAQLFDMINAAAQREEIPDEEFLIGYDPKQGDD